MSKSLTYKILAAVMALSAANWALPADVSAGYVEYGDYYIAPTPKRGGSHKPYKGITKASA